MYYRNKFDKTGECSRMGESAEVLFKKLLARLGDVSEAKLEDQINHTDFILARKDKKICYEVKARKRVSRKDSTVTDDKIWLEFANVQGNKGWLYGKADYLAFEREHDFVIVAREHLKNMAEAKCKLFPLVNYSDEALYRGYQRKGRNDLVTMVMMQDIIDIAEEIWPKTIT